MARRSSTNAQVATDLNLAPIMNMVMILIPMLLVMVQFSDFAMSPVEATAGSGKSAGDTESDEVKPPRVLISISSDGFRVADFLGSPDFADFSKPIARCAGIDDENGATVCLQPGAAVEDGDYSGLDYAGLYNKLVQIRLHDKWKKAYDKPENAVILLTAEPDVPAGVIVRTMDLGRYFLDPAGEGRGDLANPVEEDVADASAYYLGGGLGEATLDDLLRAGFFITDGAPGLNRDKQGNPVNILPLFPSVSLVTPR